MTMTEQQETTEKATTLISLEEADRKASEAIAEYWKELGFDGYW